MYESSIVSTSGEILSQPEFGGVKSFVGLSSYDLGFIPLGANSTWACTIISGTDDMDGFTCGIFSDTSTPFFGKLLSNSFLAPKSFVNGSAFYMVFAEIESSSDILLVNLAAVLAFKFDGINVPTPVFKPTVVNTDIVPSKLKRSCVVEPNTFILLEDQYSSYVITLVLACSHGPVIIDVTLVEGPSDWLGPPTMQQRYCNPLGPVSSNCDCTINPDSEDDDYSISCETK